MESLELSHEVEQPTNTPEPVQLDHGQVSPPMSEDHLNSRATKANVGLGSVMGQDFETIKQAFREDQEKDWRKAAASGASFLDYQKKQADLFNRLRIQDQTISPEELGKYTLEEQDPDTIIEKGFASAYFKAVFDQQHPFVKYTDMGEAVDKIPQHVNIAHRTGEAFTARNEYFNTLKENAENALSAESTGGKVVDFIKDAFQPYMEYKLRGLSNDTGWSLQFLGSALKAEADEIVSLPLDEAKKKLDVLVPQLMHDNPGLAVMLMNYLVGQSTDDEKMDNIYSALGLSDAAGMLGITKGTKGIYTAIRGASKDAVKAAALVPNVSPEVAVAIGKGDMHAAAVQTAAERFVADTRGTINPMKRAVESMPTFMRRDEMASRMDPGNKGMNLVNEMEIENARLINDLGTNIADTASANRIPEITTSKINFEKVYNHMMETFPDTANMLMNVKGPIWDPFSKSWFVARIIGRNNSTFFGSLAEAENAAKAKDIALSSAVKKRTTQVYGGIEHTPYGAQEEKYYLYGAEIKPTSELGKSGNGYYLTDLIPIKEDSPIARDLLGMTDRSRPPVDWTGGWIDTFLRGILRSPEETQSLDQQIARKQATYAPANFLDMVRSHTDDIRAISPSSSLYGLTHIQEWDEFKRTLQWAQKERNPENLRPGWFYRTPGELDNYYLQNFQHLPSERVTKAYFQFKRLWEADRWMRTQAVVRNKTRLGVQEHTFLLEGKDGVVRLPPVEAIRQNILPQGHGTILVLKRDPDHTHMWASDAIPQLARAEMDKDVREGRGAYYKIFNTEDRTWFQNFPGRVRGRLKKEIEIPSGAKIEYVFARRAETRPLDLNKQIGHQYGGHLVPDYQYSVAQPKMVFDPISKTWHYEGDTHAFFVKNHAMGAEFAKYMTEFKNLMAEGKETEAIELARQKLHIGADEFHKHFKPSKGPNGEDIAPRWNMRDDFHVKEVGQNIIDLGKEALESKYTKIDPRTGKILQKFRDGTRSGNPARQSVVEFTQQRDAYEMQEVQNIGTVSNPVYKMDPAKLIDPIPMMMRGLKRIIHNLYADDYKIQAMEHWLFGKNVLDPSTGKMVGAANWLKDGLDKVEYSPFHYWAHEPEWKPGFEGSLAHRLLMADRMKIKMFLGMPSWMDASMRRFEESIADSIYHKIGSRGEYVPTWLVGKITSGPMYARTMLYGAKMGFGNIRQFFLHGVTTMNAFLISPKYALHGSLGALFHGFASMGLQHAGYFDQLANKSGLFKPGDFKLFMDGLLNSGFLKTESGQHAMRDSPMASDILRNRFQTLLHIGTAPFRGGVKIPKIVSWYMAANEWRNGELGRSLSGSRWSKIEGPARVGAPTKDDFGLILARADDLAHNMSRASTSAIQKGFTSFGSQFTAFNQRVIELLAGKRLTVPEKARLFFGYAGFYGIPAATGIFGVNTVVRRLLQGDDPMTGKPYVPGENLVSTLLMEGMVATGLYEATGHVPNVGEAYGAKDLNIISDALNGHTGFLNMWGGAVYNGVVNTGESLTPFIQWADTLLNDNDERFRLTPQHYIDVFKEIPVVNYIDRAYMGATTGHWLSRNGAYLNDTTATHAILMNMFGLQDQETADIYGKELDVQDWKAQERSAENHARHEAQMVFNALSMDPPNINEAKIHHMNIKAWLSGVPADKQTAIISQIEKDLHQPMKDKINFEWLLGRDRPDKLRELGIKGWQDQLERRNK